MSQLAELFPDADFRFHLTLRRSDPLEFFRPRDASGRILAERGHWLAENPARHAALRPEGEALLAEFAGCCVEWKLIGSDTPASVRALGAALEPDFLLLSPDDTGAFRLRAGALCFPTGWALEEKLGHTLDFIHGVVPGLNAALASPIQQFLSRLKPGVAFLRDNWGLAATDELNLHPALRRPAPVLPVALDRLWLRVEHQALFALPRTGGIVFGIRVALHRLDAVQLEPAVASGLARALATMPDELAAYKNLAAVRPALLEILRGA